MTENTESAVNKVTQKLTAILDVLAPIKTIQTRTHYDPWLSKATKKKINERNSAQKKAARTNLESDWKEYKKKRNKVNSILKTEKTTWQEKKVSEFGSDSSSIWKNLKRWLCWSIDEGIIYTKPADLVRVMNLFFVNKVQKLRQKLPHNPGDPISLVQKLMQNRSCSFELRPVHPEEVYKILSKLKSSSSCGVDEISSSVLKLIKNEITPVLTHIVNLSISQKTFPQYWKKARVIPLHKKDELLYPKNYRPVSLLPVFSKVLERCIFVQMVSYLEENNLLHPAHHGFRAKHSTVTALLQMFDTWIDAFEQNEVSAVLMLDMSAAFDVVDHAILLSKLELYGFRECALSWIASYLMNRSQSVYIEGHLSDSLSVECGVPQGSILGPLLYVLYTNDLPEAVHEHHLQQDHQQGDHLYNINCHACGGLCLYADDSTFSLSSGNMEELNANLDKKYQDIAKYMDKNRLILNSEKTNLLIMTSARKHANHQDFGIYLDTGSEHILPLNEEKLLGVNLSNCLSWNKHVRDTKQSLVSTLTSRINALAKICQYTSFINRKMVANGIVMSYLTYLIPLYGGCPEYLLTGLQTLQNRAARLVTNSNWYTPSSIMLSQIGWLNVRQMIIFHSLVLVFKTKQDMKPVYLYNKISTRFNVDTRLAATNGIREVRKIKTKIGKQSFLPRTIDQWNNLPPDIRTITSLKKFKMKLKLWVKQNL